MSALAAPHALHPIVQVRAGERLATQDQVAVEEPLEIRLVEATDPTSERVFTITMRTPGEDEDLALGLLFTEGIVRGPQDILAFSSTPTTSQGSPATSIVVKLRPGVESGAAARTVYASAACGVCGKSELQSLRAQPGVALPLARPWLGAAVVTNLPARLQRAQATFAATGGLHAAGLFAADGTLLLLREDVGRHNAVDKLVGARLRSARPHDDDVILMVSGRTSFELVSKALMAGFPVLAAVGAPSSLAVDLARDGGLTLLGFVRDNRFNVYAGVDRLAS